MFSSFDRSDLRAISILTASPPGSTLLDASERVAATRARPGYVKQHFFALPLRYLSALIALK
jgi:hypothetical protein